MPPFLLDFAPFQIWGKSIYDPTSDFGAPKGDFHIVIQLILVLICLQISYTTKSVLVLQNPGTGYDQRYKKLVKTKTAQWDGWAVWQATSSMF